MTTGEAREMIVQLKLEHDIPDRVLLDDVAMIGFDGCECQQLDWEQLSDRIWRRWRRGCGTGTRYIDMVLEGNSEFSPDDLRERQDQYPRYRAILEMALSEK